LKFTRFAIHQFYAITSPLNELQKTFDEYSDDLGIFSLDESGISIEIKTKSSEYSYNLEQLKKLKVELEDPLLQSLKEVS
jgi:hypothetical protein